ncbi:M28 family peptidase [Vicingaceae bacterium]|nr:M28 family peptidase [Vicingaceae bacterium]
MKKIILIIGIVAIGSTGVAQKYDKNAEKYSKTITAGELKEHLYIIASDKFEGRETGKKGQKMAMDYLIQNFKSYGIKPLENQEFTQTFNLVEQTTKNVTLAIGNKKYTVLKDFSISPSIIVKQELENEIVFVGYGIEEEGYNNYTGLNVKGKAVFIMEGVPKKRKIVGEWSVKKRIELAKEKGAILVMYNSSKLKDNLIKHEHYYSKPKLVLKDDIDKNEIIVLATTTVLTEEMAKQAGMKWKKVVKGMKEKGGQTLKFTLSIDKPTEYLTSENILAFIPGTEKPDELIILTAHYDHIGKEGDVVFNGADDDGTGTVTMLEIAQAFQQAVVDSIGPKRSILIMPVSGEEKGLLGSKYYSNHPIFPLENTVANLNVDMIGRYDENHSEEDNYIYLIGSDKLSSELHDVSKKVNELYTKIELDYTFNDENDPNRFYYRSDHYNFAKNNVPVIFYFSGVHEDYHKETDTVEKIDYEKTARVARLVFLTAWELANREGRIKLD